MRRDIKISNATDYRLPNNRQIIANIGVKTSQRMTIATIAKGY